MTDPNGSVGEGLAEVDACSLEIERQYEVIPAVICSMCCLFGIIYCFFGKVTTGSRHISITSCQRVHLNFNNTDCIPHGTLFPIYCTTFDKGL